MRVVGRVQRLAAQQVAAVGVGQGEGIDAREIGGAKPAFVIGAPDGVGSAGVGQRFGGPAAGPFALARDGQSVAPQQLADGALGRQHVAAFHQHHIGARRHRLACIRAPAPGLDFD